MTGTPREKGRHDGHVVLVTGAANGIGRATALRLAEEARPSCARCERGGPARRRLRDAVRHRRHVVDVTSQSAVDELVRQVIERYARIDAVANIAGIMDGFLAVHEMDDAVWSRVMAVNVDGPMRVCRAVLPSMIARGRGVIVNVSSEPDCAADVPAPPTPPRSTR